jgi:oligosaccharide repeat unit polymerase
MILIQILLLIGLTLFTRRINGTWLTPAGINNLLWCFYLLGAWIFQGEFLMLHPIGLFIILLFCLSFSLGSLPLRKKPAIKGDPIKMNNLPLIRKLLRLFNYVLIILCGMQLILIPYASFQSFGIPVAYYYQPVNMILMGLKVRFDPSFVTSTLLNLMMGINFASFFIMGAFLALRNITKDKISWLSIISIIILVYLGLMLVFMFNAKSSMIFIFTMIISSYIAFNVCFNQDPKWLKKQSVYISFSLIIVFLVFILMIAARYSTGDREIIKNTLVTYGFGHTYCFDNFIYMEMNDIIWPKGFGINTFYSLAKVFGYRLVEGVYEDKLVFINGSESNVYTFLRGFIYDFGIIGFPLVILIISLFVHRWFEKVNIDHSLWHASLISLVYQFILFSPIISPLVYMNILIAYLVFMGTVWAVKKTVYDSKPQEQLRYSLQISNIG